MKKKTFFYKFDKNKHTSKATYHGHQSNDSDRDSINNKIESLIEKKTIINELLKNKGSEIKSYYKSRKSNKIELINNTPVLKKYSEYFLGNNKIILTIRFDKVLTEYEISEIEVNLGVEIVRISRYDTQIEIVTNDSEKVLEEIKKTVSNETIKLQEMLKKGEIGEYNKTILAIESLGVDLYNRERINDIKGENLDYVNVSLSKNSIYNGDEELNILKELYNIYKTERSEVDTDSHSININNQDSLHGNFIFKNMNTNFYNAISVLLDGVMNIEVLDSTIETIYKPIELNLDVGMELESTETSLNNVCIVDSKINTNKYVNGNLIEGTTYEDTSHPHGTNVGILAMYGQIDKSWTTLPSPVCNIYNIASIAGTYGNIQYILEEAEAGNCKIINLSLGPKTHLFDNEGISDIAKKLDRLLENRDLLLILSGGNIDPIKTSYQELKQETANINTPKDSISTICIGAKRMDTNDIALYSRKNNICSNEMIGGQEGWFLRLRDMKKPDFIDYGENIVTDGTNWSIGNGTSFAAPLVSNKAVRILNTYGNISTNTIKGLLLNYSNNSFTNNKYPDNETFLRHSGRGVVDIESLLNDNNQNLNIVIEDYIKDNQKKEYDIELPRLSEDIQVIIKRSISYNPPVSEKYHLKYSKFCVNSKMWSSKYQEKMEEIYSQDIEDNEKLSSWNKRKKAQWKEGYSHKEYKKPVDRLNYFGSNHMRSSNSLRTNILNKDMYNELATNTKIIINGHSRNKYKHVQKFSYVMSMDISQLSNKQKFIEDFYSLNKDIVIHGNDVDNINKNIEERNTAFINIDDINIDVESIGNF